MACKTRINGSEFMSEMDFIDKYEIDGDVIYEFFKATEMLVEIGSVASRLVESSDPTDDCPDRAFRVSDMQSILRYARTEVARRAQVV